MNRREIQNGIVASVLAGFVLLTVRCGSGTSSSTGGGGTLPPSISATSISPIVAQQNAAAFNLTVQGSGFTANSQVIFNGNSVPTILVNASELTASIGPNNISSFGTFNVLVQDSGVSTSALSFFVVPVVVPQAVAVSPGFPPQQAITINVPTFSPPKLQVSAVGIGTTAGGLPIQLSQGKSYSLLIVGKGISAGTYYFVSGNRSDVSITQPIVSDFAQTTDGTPAVNVNVTISPTAVIGARSLVVTNPAGEVSMFVGGLEIGSGT